MEFEDFHQSANQKALQAIHVNSENTYTRVLAGRRQLFLCRSLLDSIKRSLKDKS